MSAEGIKRYGFHGLSYEFIARALPEHSPRASGRVIVAHLGNGSSMCGMLDRKSMVLTMGFTAIDGLMMGTRSGAIDPGVLLYLMDNKGMGSLELTRLLYKVTLRRLPAAMCFVSTAMIRRKAGTGI